jgi:hypothetical protein
MTVKTVAPVIRRTVVDTPHQVAATVARARRSGRLVAMTDPIGLPDGRAHVVVTLTVPPPPRRRISLAATSLIAISLTLAALAVWLVVRIAAFLAVHGAVIAGFLVIVLIVGLALRPGHRAFCPGLHCGGCSR